MILNYEHSGVTQHEAMKQKIKFIQDMNKVNLSYMDMIKIKSKNIKPKLNTSKVSINNSLNSTINASDAALNNSKNP